MNNMDITFNYLEKSYTIKLEKVGDIFKMSIGNDVYEIKDFSVSSNMISLKLNNDLINIYYGQSNDKLYIMVDGEYYVFEQARAEKKKTEAVVSTKANSVVSPMPGLLVKIPVKVGDKVSAGKTLAIVEAMKMQNELRAQIDGIVKKINYKEGEQVDAFVPIVELEVL